MSIRVDGVNVPRSLAFWSILAAVAAGITSARFSPDPPPGGAGLPEDSMIQGEARIRIDSLHTPGDPGAGASALFKITKPGSYYFAGNITGVSGKSGIEIAASGVTVDLMGFELRGVPGSLNGIENNQTSGLRSIEIRNGCINSWGRNGVDLGSTGSLNCRVVGVRVNSNNAGGLMLGQGTLVSDCMAANNLGVGISVGPGGAVIHCVSSCNVSDGIAANLGSSVVDCTLFKNGGDGIEVTGACTVRGNTCMGNGSESDGGAGIHALWQQNRIESNHCLGGNRGIEVSGIGNLVIKNTCSGNHTNWVLNKSNAWGTIHNVIGAGGVNDVNGDAAPGNLPFTADGNANWTY